MKLSDLEKIGPLRKRLREINAMENALCRYPAFDANLVIDGNYINIDNQSALTHVRAASAKVVDELSSLGVESNE
jgi:hypothetical protein